MKNLVSFSTLYVFLFYCNAATLPKSVSSQPAYQPALCAKGGMFGFIENKGQIIDQKNNLNPSVLYLYNGNGLHVQLKQSGFSYEVWKIVSGYQLLALGKNQELNNQPLFDKNRQSTADSIFIHRIDISFVNANPNAKIISSDVAPDYINYYTTGTPEEGVTNVHHYKKVLYQNIYNNIDVEFLLNDKKQNGAFKYNFIIHPGGNVNEIKLQLSGCSSSSLTDNGHIIMETAYGNIDESIPLSYQLDENNSQQKITSNFKLETLNCFGIAIGNYDETKTLIIDPVPWATYYGGSGSDWGGGITTDKNGNVIVTGSTNSSSGIATTGAYQDTLMGNNDVYILKFNSSGIRLWCTYYGGSDQDEGQAITTDSIGNVIITGRTTSTSGIATTGAHQTTYGGGSSDAFIVKFNSFGLLQWGTYYGGSGGSGIELGNGIATDVNGNIFITGITNSTSGIATTGAYQTTPASGFISKFNQVGVILWGTYYNIGGLSIVTDSNSNVIVTGSTSYTNGVATTGAYQTTIGGIYDAVIVKFNLSGSLLWATYYGGSGGDIGQSISVDRKNNIIIYGLTSSISGIASSGACQTVFGGGSSDGFVVKFSSLGTRLWATYYGGSGDESAAGGTYGICADNNGNIYFSGNTNSNSGIASVGAFQPNYAGGSSGGFDDFVVKLDSSGNRQWGTYYGGVNLETECGIATDNNGNVFITGETFSQSGLVTAGAFQSVYGGGNGDAYIAAFTSSGGLINISNDSISGSQSICAGDTFSTLTGNIPTGGNGIYFYKWQKSTTSSISGFMDAGGNDSSQNYSSGALSVKTWFRRIVISGGSFDTTSAILVSMKMQSGFSINNSSQCLNGNNFLFNDTSIIIGGTLSRSWNFGTGVNDTSSSINPTKTYSSTGTYPVKLVTSGTNGCPDDSITLLVTINPKPIAGFTINNPAQCLNGNSFSLIDTSTISSGVLSRMWNFGSGINDTSSAINPTKIYSVVNNYSIKLVLISEYGCKDSITKTVTVNPKPNAGFTLNNVNQCLNGNNFSFTDTSNIGSGTLTRLWNFGTGNSDTSSALSPNKTFSIANTYSIKLVETSNNGCKDSIIKTVNVIKPNPGFSVNNYVQCVNGNSFGFTDTSTVNVGTLTRLWNFGGGVSDSSTFISPNKIYSASGTYGVKLISNSYGCKDSVTKTITVNPKPTVGFTINNITQCLGGNNFLFNDTSKISNGTLTRKWNFGNAISDTSALINPTKTYNNANSYEVKLISVSNNNCKDSLSKTVSVVQPKAGFIQNSLSQCLIGNSFHFDDTTSVTVNRLWNLGDLTTNTNDTFNKTYAIAGQYNVKLKITDSRSCTDSVTKVVTVKPNPAQPVISPLTKSLLQSTPADGYQWYLNNNPITGANSQTLILTQNGTYSVKIDSANGCSNLSNSYAALSVGVAENFHVDKINIYPNPATNEIFINAISNKNPNEVLVEIFDLKGSKLFSSTEKADHVIKINLNSFDAGMYFMKVNNNVEKFVKVD